MGNLAAVPGRLQRRTGACRHSYIEGSLSSLHDVRRMPCSTEEQGIQPLFRTFGAESTQISTFLIVRIRAGHRASCAAQSEPAE